MGHLRGEGPQVEFQGPALLLQRGDLRLDLRPAIRHPGLVAQLRLKAERRALLQLGGLPGQALGLAAQHLTLGLE